jgi:hypothetical protein
MKYLKEYENDDNIYNFIETLPKNTGYNFRIYSPANKKLRNPTYTNTNFIHLITIKCRSSISYSLFTKLYDETVSLTASISYLLLYNINSIKTINEPKYPLIYLFNSLSEMSTPPTSNPITPFILIKVPYQLWRTYTVINNYEFSKDISNNNIINFNITPYIYTGGTVSSFTFDIIKIHNINYF